MVCTILCPGQKTVSTDYEIITCTMFERVRVCLISAIARSSAISADDDDDDDELGFKSKVNVVAPICNIFLIATICKSLAAAPTPRG